jgi:hypothetical protein
MGEIGEMNEELQSIYLSNLDEAPARRLAREVFKDIQLNIDHCLLKVIYLTSQFSMFFLNTYILSFFTRLTQTYLTIKQSKILKCAPIKNCDI